MRPLADRYRAPTRSIVKVEFPFMYTEEGAIVAKLHDGAITVFLTAAVLDPRHQREIAGGGVALHEDVIITVKLRRQADLALHPGLGTVCPRTGPVVAAAGIVLKRSRTHRLVEVQHELRGGAVEVPDFVPREGAAVDLDVVNVALPGRLAFVVADPQASAPWWR